MALVERAERQARERAQGRVDEVHSDQCRKLGSGRRFIPQAFRSENVGILAIEVYFPDTYVAQEELERHDGVALGKYTKGLGQERMSFPGDQEDVVSMSMTAVQLLLEKNNVDPRDVGRLDVGTESSLDSSKSIKTFLMALFSDCGNHDIEGVDSLNACYGGTAALLNAVNWVESRAWDGRAALVVAGDVAMYGAGPARPTGGAGAVAVLVGPDAPLDLERGLTASFMAHEYDFYKPCGLYPLAYHTVIAASIASAGSLLRRVDGKDSVKCYLTALERCYAALRAKFERSLVREACHRAPPIPSYSDKPMANHRQGGGEGTVAGCALPRNDTTLKASSELSDTGAVRSKPVDYQEALESGLEDTERPFSLADVDFCVMHSPFTKMVRKGFALLTCLDAAGTCGPCSTAGQAEPGTDNFGGRGIWESRDAMGQPSWLVHDVQGKGWSTSPNNAARLSLPKSDTMAPSRDIDVSAASAHCQVSGIDGHAMGGACPVAIADTSPGLRSERGSCQSSCPVAGCPEGSRQQLQPSDGLAPSAQQPQLCVDALAGPEVSVVSRNQEPQTGAQDGAGAPGNAGDPRPLQPRTNTDTAAGVTHAVPGLPLEQQTSAEVVASGFQVKPAGGSGRRMDSTTTSAAEFERKVAPSLGIAQQCGNMYTASLLAGLAWLVESQGAALAGCRVLMYSYGSGAAASLFSLVGRATCSGFTLASIASRVDLRRRLEARQKASPEEFVETLELLESRYRRAGYTPACPVNRLRPGTFYLSHVDANFRRYYVRKELAAAAVQHMMPEVY